MSDAPRVLQQFAVPELNLLQYTLPACFLGFFISPALSGTPIARLHRH